MQVRTLLETGEWADAWVLPDHFRSLPIALAYKDMQIQFKSLTMERPELVLPCLVHVSWLSDIFRRVPCNWQVEKNQQRIHKLVNASLALIKLADFFPSKKHLPRICRGCFLGSICAFRGDQAKTTLEPCWPKPQKDLHRWGQICNSPKLGWTRLQGGKSPILRNSAVGFSKLD